MRDIIFVSMEDWDDIWRRNQFVCAELAKRHPNSKILFVGLKKDVSNHLRHRRKMADLFGELTYSIPAIPNITVTHYVKFLPNTLTPCRHVNDAVMRTHVRNVAHSLGIKSPLLWLNPHSTVHMVGKMGECATIYDITDDWTKFTQTESLTELIKRQDAELCRRADAVIVCSQGLYEAKRSLTRNLHLVPNGVDANHYKAVLDATNDEAIVVPNWPRPVLGYTGTIHPDRVDMGLIEEVARRMPHASIVLIGPVLLASQYVERLKRLKNVVFTGPMPYKILPRYMRAFDVCITPHRMTPFTESLNPIKLWEYLAAGKPIVSTDVAGFRDYPQLVHLARDADEFICAIDDALHEDPALADARRAEAHRHSWESRVDAIEAVIRSCTSKASCEVAYD